ncbi:uncharacterized protein LOC132558385 [Ylistrum balloti]|uniref:uncharacterized protein LOC132558385 n=1 Tax=Ylistrum balloti TaxID=509963 RepID=UPI0029059B19|nr:uncharacterized protein LOC132558385 [Ylistrum balloti]
MSTNEPIPSCQIPLRAKGNSQCSVHRNKDVILHCSDCDILVCISCSITIHNGHKLVEMSDVIPLKRDVLRDFINDTENNKLIEIRDEIQSIEDKLVENDTRFVKLRQDMIQQSNICKNKIDVLTDEFDCLCQKMEKENRELMLKYKRELKQRYKLLVKQMKECKELLQSGTSVDLFDATTELISAGLPPPVEPELNQIDFRPCEAPTKHVRKALGTLHKQRSGTSADVVRNEADTQDKFLEQPAVLTEFKSPIDCTSLCPTPFGTWLNEAESKTLLLVDFQGQIIEKMKHSCEITDISISPKTKNVWFCCAGNKTIHEVTPSTNTPDKMFETENCPTCLCVTKDEQVVVWTKDPDFLHENLFIYSTTGKVEFSTCPPDQEIWSVRMPFTIRQCLITGNLALLCRGNTTDEEPCGKITVYSQDLIFLFAYGGESSEGPCFVPWSVVYDSKGNLVIGDEQGNKIHFVSGTGTYLRTIRFDVQTDNLSLGIQSDDILWLCFYSDKSEKRGIFRKVVRKLSDSVPHVPKTEVKTMKYYK